MVTPETGLCYNPGCLGGVCVSVCLSCMLGLLHKDAEPADKGGGGCGGQARGWDGPAIMKGRLGVALRG